MSVAQTMTSGKKNDGGSFEMKDRVADVRISNIKAAQSISQIMRTSLGPKGMDKLIETGRGEVIISNDGATILKNLSVVHPTAGVLVQTSKAQDVEAGDGTTSVVVLAGSLLEKAEELLKKGIHPSQISDGFAQSLKLAESVVNECSEPINLTDDAQLLQCVTTALSSKVIAQNSAEIAPLAIKAVKRVVDLGKADSLDLREIRLIKKLGGTLDDTVLIDGISFSDRRPVTSAGGPSKISGAKIALLQFSLAAPKTDIENNIAVSDYSQIDRVLKEERKHILGLVKKIAESGANVVLLQKSIVRDSINDIALHFLAKKKIMVVRDIERTDVEFICKSVGCTPVAHIDGLTREKLGFADLADELELEDGSKIFRMVVPECKTASIVVRGSNQLVLDEAERSIHDALCVIRCLIKNKGVVPGGGAVEIEIWRKLEEWAHKEERGALSAVVAAYAEAMEIIPSTLAENCGLSSVNVITELRHRHLKGLKNSGLKAKSAQIVDNTIEHHILQPALVNISALGLATEAARMILKIDDILQSR